MLHDERKSGSKFGGGEADLEYHGKPINTAADCHSLTYCISITEKLFAPLGFGEMCLCTCTQMYRSPHRKPIAGLPTRRPSVFSPLLFILRY